ncbi:MAG: hypothetical protein HY204_12210 [Nitrospirae bacterium]|nr:hypothetical protein [Nitrospirota bacterium]
MKTLLPLLLLSGALFPSASSAQEAVSPEQSFIESGDHHWNLRAEHAKGTDAAPQEVDRAIAAYRQALAAAPESLAVRQRLMRAFFFKGEYTTEDKAEKKRIFDEGKRIGEESLQRIRQEASRRAGRPMDQSGPVELAPIFNDSPDVIACFLWSSANWGEWALAYGKFQAVRQGAATKIRDLATAVTLMDPNYAEGGGYRVLGRLIIRRLPFLLSRAGPQQRRRSNFSGAQTGSGRAIRSTAFTWPRPSGIWIRTPGKKPWRRPKRSFTTRPGRNF